MYNCKLLTNQLIVKIKSSFLLDPAINIYSQVTSNNKHRMAVCGEAFLPQPDVVSRRMNKASDIGNSFKSTYTFTDVFENLSAKVSEVPNCTFADNT